MFNNEYYKKNIIFPTNITELGSSVQCDIDEAPFIIGDLVPTTFQVSEEELSLKLSNTPTNASTPHFAIEKEGPVNLRAYVDFGCDGERCMNIRSTLVTSQIATELIDLTDDSLEPGSCTSYVDVYDDDIRRWFCQRFGTFVPNLNNSGTIADMNVNYVRPGGSKGENYYETYNEIAIQQSPVGTGDYVEYVTDKKEIKDWDNTNVATEKFTGVINDGDNVIPGDKCGYWSDGSLATVTDVKYFYAMDLHENNPKTNLQEFPFDGSKLGSDYSNGNPGVDNLVLDDEGIAPFTTQTPYFFYFGLVPGKTALHKLVAKFFADKIDKETLGKITENPNETNVPASGDEEESAQAIIGSCIKTR
jgi:hypothetical protein